MRMACRLAVVGVTIGCSLIWGAEPQSARKKPAAGKKASAAQTTQSAQLFETQIAPLLASRCLECHDASSKKGSLDLSRKEAALAGGESGPSIVAGKTAESLLWEMVEADLMPQDRPPLSPEEKAFLRQWIESGARWTADVIDPAIHGSDPRVRENWLRRLTVTEYIETVRSAVGVDIEKEARRILPPDLRADGFQNTAYNLNVDLGHVEAYAQLAYIIVSRADVMKLAREHSDCQKLDDACMRKTIAGIGKWLLRGPLQQHEIDAYLAISRAVAEQGGDFKEAVSYVVEAMLQSPRFIYRIENQRRDDPSRQVDPYELASRMSYIIWGAPPDKELMAAADSGELADRDAVEAHVQRMLKDPRAVERSAEFISQWLDLARLENLRPDSDRFPKWNSRLAEDMRDETLAFFRHVAWDEKRPLVELMNAQVTYVTPRLAEHYGLPWNASGAATGEHALPDPLVDTDDLQVLYIFGSGKGDTIRDASDSDTPLDLKIGKSSAVRWRDNGLEVRQATLISTGKPARRLTAAVKKSNAITIEAWITPADTRQSGPARILTLSSGISQRNFTLGQDGDRFDVRFRATRTDTNGLPSLASPKGSVKNRLTQVVYTRDKSGRAKLYLNGQQVSAGNVDGNLSNWDNGFTLALANETSNDRPWRGTLHRVAIYSRALTSDELRAGGAEPKPYDLSGVSGRGGLLTQGSVLTVGGDEASMVTRGLFVLHDLLYSSVGDPPPCVDTTPVPSKPGMSQRGIAMERIANNSCGGCHSKFEPLAFGLEKFDGLGTFHDVDQYGNRLRDDGEILFPGEEKPVSYKSCAELMDLLAGSERVRMNMTRKVTQFALGRPLVAADAPALAQIHEQAQEGGGTYASLISAIVVSDLVQKTQAEKN